MSRFCGANCSAMTMPHRLVRNEKHPPEASVSGQDCRFRASVHRPPSHSGGSGFESLRISVPPADRVTLSTETLSWIPSRPM